MSTPYLKHNGVPKLNGGEKLIKKNMNDNIPIVLCIAACSHIIFYFRLFPDQRKLFQCCTILLYRTQINKHIYNLFNCVFTKLDIHTNSFVHTACVNINHSFTKYSNNSVLINL